MIPIAVLTARAAMRLLHPLLYPNLYLVYCCVARCCCKSRVLLFTSLLFGSFLAVTSEDQPIHLTLRTLKRKDVAVEVLLWVVGWITTLDFAGFWASIWPYLFPW